MVLIGNSTLPLFAASPLPLSSGAFNSAPDNLHFATRPVSCRASVQTFADETGKAQRHGSLYEVLRVKKTASFTEIKTAYRSLAKVYHPDASESDGTDFIELHNAYTTLSDPAARAVYDLSLGGPRRRPAFARGQYSRVYPTRRWETDQCW